MRSSAEAQKYELALQLVGSIKRGSCLCTDCRKRFDHFSKRLLALLAPDPRLNTRRLPTRRKCTCQVC